MNANAPIPEQVPIEAYEGETFEPEALYHNDVNYQEIIDSVPVKPNNASIKGESPQETEPETEAKEETTRAEITPEMLGAILGSLDGDDGFPDRTAKIGTDLPSTPERTPKEKFELIEIASKSVLVDSSNLPSSHKDAERIAPDYDHCDPDKGVFPIPTYEGLRVDGETEQLSRLENSIRKVGVRLSMIDRAFTADDESRSIQNANLKQFLDKLQGTGNDSQIRGLFSRRVVREVNGIRPELFQSIHEDGKGEVDPSDVRDGRKYWFAGPSAFQAAFWYELNKSTSEDEFNRTLVRAVELLNEASARGRYSPQGARFTDRDVQGIWVGVGFMHKAMFPSFKYTGLVKNENGYWEMGKINSVGLLQEISTKFRSYDYANFSPVEVSNLAVIAESALEASLRYRHNPESKEFKRSQFILQRMAKIISDMRYQTGIDPENDEAMQQINDKQREAAAMSSKLMGSGMYQRPAVKIREDGAIQFDGQPVRNGGSPVSSALWEQVAYFSDISTHAFPNLKYIYSDEFSHARRLIDTITESDNPGDRQYAAQAALGISDRPKATPPPNTIGNRRKRRKELRRRGV